MVVTFDVRAGLLVVVPGAKCIGSFVNNTEDEYNQLEWLDPREKPLYAVIEIEALRIMRKRIRDKINQRTDELIKEGFIYRDTRFTCSLEEQFNMLNVWLFKDGLTYPYSFKCSDDVDGEGVYINFIDAADIMTCYMTGFAFIAGVIATGRVIKDSLGTMNRTQLEELRDNR